MLLVSLQLPLPDPFTFSRPPCPHWLDHLNRIRRVFHHFFSDASVLSLPFCYVSTQLVAALWDQFYRLLKVSVSLWFQQNPLLCCTQKFV